jgi:hypothetical protein
MQKVEEKKNVP